MTMTETQAAQFDNHLEKIGKFDCPVCVSPWSAQQFGDIIQPTAIRGESLVQDSSVAAVAELYCNKCGNTMLFNCQVAGISVQ